MPLFKVAHVHEIEIGERTTALLRELFGRPTTNPEFIAKLNHLLDGLEALGEPAGKPGSRTS